MKNLHKILSLVALVSCVSQVMPYEEDQRLYQQYGFTDETAVQSRRKPATVRAASPKPSRPNPYEQYAFTDTSEGVGYRKVSDAERKRILEQEAQKQPRKVSFDEYLERETGLTPAVEDLD